MSLLDCGIDQGYDFPCSSIGGVERVWIGNFSAATTYTFDVNNVITGATNANEVYLFDSDIEFNGLEQNMNANRDNGTVHFESILSIKMIGLDEKVRNIALKLARAPIYAVIKSNFGNYFLAGLETPGRATSGALSLGTTMDDMMGASMEFTFKSKTGIYLLDGSLVGTDIPLG